MPDAFAGVRKGKASPYSVWYYPRQVGICRQLLTMLAWLPQPVEQRKGGIASLFAKQAAKSPLQPASPPDLSKPTLRMTSPTAERKPKSKSQGKVPLPSKIDSFFGKMGTPAKTPKAPKRKAPVAASEDGSSDVEIVESPVKKVRVALKHEAEGGGEEVAVVTKGEDGEVEVEERGVQETENPA